MLPEPSGARRWFEAASQLLVVYSVVVFYMEAEMSVPGATRAASGFWLWNERIVVGIFSLEYLFRWATSNNRLRYPFTLLAIIDAVAIGPSIIGLTVNFRSLRLVRILPLLWMFKLYRYNHALHTVMHGFRRVKGELAVVGLVAVAVLVFSAVAMHEFERDAQPDKFGRLSDSLWWSFVTLSTVGYGDLYPITPIGRAVAVVTMLVGIGILGTLISLVGSSFLITMRREEDESTETPQPPIPIAGRPPVDVPWTGRRAG